MWCIYAVKTMPWFRSPLRSKYHRLKVKCCCIRSSRAMSRLIQIHQGYNRRPVGMYIRTVIIMLRIRIIKETIIPIIITWIKIRIRRRKIRRRSKKLKLIQITVLVLRRILRSTPITEVAATKILLLLVTLWTASRKGISVGSDRDRNQSALMRSNRLMDRNHCKQLISQDS